MLITLEGIEGAGKTSQIEFIVEYLTSQGHDCIAAREPGDTAIGRKIRAILLDPAHQALDPLAELLLYEADRAQHLKEKIRPALQRGQTVICDRFHDATTVYQGVARGLAPDMIHALHELVLKGLKPDITFLLDLSPEIGLARAWKQLDSGRRTACESRFEKENAAFHQRVREGYLELARLEPDRFCIIDASGTQQEVRDAILRRLSRSIRKSY